MIFLTWILRLNLRMTERGARMTKRGAEDDRDERFEDDRKRGMVNKLTFL